MMTKEEIKKAFDMREKKDWTKEQKQELEKGETGEKKINMSKTRK